MTLVAQEQYVLHHLALIDMERVIRSVGYLSSTEDQYLKDVLFRDAVVCYAKPFSGNRSLSGTGKLRISDSFVPEALRESHDAVLSMRSQLFAHMDLDRQTPQVPLETRGGKKYFGAFSVVGYERVFAAHLVDPLRKLASAAHSYLLRELSAMREAERDA
jgi:hypothetical protein